MSGWICLARSIQDHWVFARDDYFKAWAIMLMEVNYQEKTTLIKGKLLTCYRGQSLLSHSSWAEKFGKDWNRSKVIRFFKLLESDQMIEQVNEQVTTRVTICNYEKFQAITKDSEQVTVQQANTTRTGDDTQYNKGTREQYKSSSTDAREKFRMFIGWQPTLDTMTETALRQAGVTDEDFGGQLKAYIAAMIDRLDERTQHQWNRSFKTTVMKYARQKPVGKETLQDQARRFVSG